MAKILYACSTCDHTLKAGEERCPEHPNADLLSLIDYSEAAATLGRKGGQAKSEAKAAAVRVNGAKGGRPNSWPGAEDGERWMRVLIESGACAGTEAWQLTRGGELVGLFDDDGERLEAGNASWRGRRSAAAPGWL